MTRVAVIALLAVAACDAGGECVEPAAGAAELGAGDLSTGFIELGDGDEMLVELGPQGLHMVVVSGRARDFAMPTDGLVHVEVGVRADGEVVAGTVADIEPSSIAADGTVELLGLRAVFTVAEVRPLDGAMVEIELVLLDGCDRPVAAARRVRLAM